MTATTAGHDGSMRHDQDGSGAAVTGPGCGAVTACHGAARHLARISNTISRVSPCISNTIRAGASPALLSRRRQTSPPRQSGPSPAPLPPSFSLYLSLSFSLSLSHFLPLLFPPPPPCVRDGAGMRAEHAESERSRATQTNIPLPSAARREGPQRQGRGRAVVARGEACGGTGGT